jgi:hypothetical protein
MLRRKPSNASEKEPTQKKKVRSIFGGLFLSFLPLCSPPIPSRMLRNGKSQRPYVKLVDEGHSPIGQQDQGPKVTRVIEVQNGLLKRWSSRDTGQNLSSLENLTTME